MSSRSLKEARFMAGCANNPGSMKGKCPSPKVSKEFHGADKKTGILKRKLQAGGALDTAGAGAFQVNAGFLRNLLAQAGADPNLLKKLSSLGGGVGGLSGLSSPFVTGAVSAPKARVAARAGKKGGRVRGDGVAVQGKTRGKFI